MRFLVDAQLPPALARMLNANGFDAEHVCDVQLGEASDTAIWDYAMKTQATIPTKDEDFASLITLRPQGPVIVWIRIGNTSKRALIQWFEPLLPAIVTALQNDEKLIEVV